MQIVYDTLGGGGSKRSFFQCRADFLVHSLLADILAGASSFFLGAMVVSVSFLDGRGDGTATVGAGEELTERMPCRFVLGIWSASLFHHCLALIKKFLGDEWIVCSFVCFASPHYQAIVKRVVEGVLHITHGSGVVVSVGEHKVTEGVLASAVLFKERNHEGRILGVEVYSSRVAVIKIPERWFGGIDTPPCFVPHTPFHILAEVVHEQLALPDSEYC